MGSAASFFPRLDRSRVLPQAQARPLDAPIALSSSLAPGAHHATTIDDSPVPYPFRIITPLKADAWERALEHAGLLEKFPLLVPGLRHGFDVGLRRQTVDSYFARTGARFRLYDNHPPAERNPAVIDAMLAEETAEGRISEPFEPEELYKIIGPFRNAPLTVAPKDGDYAKGRVCQDFSHPRNDPDDPSFNSGIDQADYPCDWGTFAQCYLLAANAPPGTQVAVFDVKAAHRRIPILPWQQAFYGLCWGGRHYLNYCAQFGGASSSGLWGGLADGFRGIFVHRFKRADSLNWADDFTFWRYLLEDGSYELDETDIYALGDELGWPWSPKKTTPFAEHFQYIGFRWDLRHKTVEVTEKKKSKYLAAAKDWIAGASFKQKDAQSLLGKLVHCAMVVPEGRSRLPALSRFAASFPNGHATRTPRKQVLADVDWWRKRLAQSFCGSSIRAIAPPCDLDIYVDASTGFGIGLVYEGTWDHWRLIPGWKRDGRDIGWAEMMAVEFGLRAAIESGIKDTHIVIKSDNKGVVGALDAGKSRNPESNRVLQRIVVAMMRFNIWLSLEWVASADNLADGPSRNVAPECMPRHNFAFKIPFVARDFVETVP